jgi:hypothetical protein
MPVLMGIYDLPGQVAGAAKQLRGRGYTDIETYAPAPFSEVEDAIDPVAGYAMTIWMVNDWQIMIGGKPFSSIPPFTIIAFELTILFAGVMTVLGLFVFGRLPRFKIDSAYSARFSGEEFGVVVRCRDRDVAEIDTLLRDHDATEVTLVES